MDIQAYLQNALEKYPVARMKVRAEIELQQLVDDKQIVVGDVYHLRGTDGERQGVVCEYLVAKGQSVTQMEIRCRQDPEPRHS